MTLIQILNQRLSQDIEWPGGWNTFWFFICKDIDVRNTLQAKRLLGRLTQTLITEDDLRDVRSTFKHTFTG